MAKHDVDPVDRLCREAVLELKLTDEQSKHPAIAAMLGNYELIPDADCNGWTLRLA